MVLEYTYHNPKIFTQGNFYLSKDGISETKLGVIIYCTNCGNKQWAIYSAGNVREFFESTLHDEYPSSTKTCLDCGDKVYPSINRHDFFNFFSNALFQIDKQTPGKIKTKMIK